MKVGQELDGYSKISCFRHSCYANHSSADVDAGCYTVETIQVADYHGEENDVGIYGIENLQLDVCAYMLHEDRVAGNGLGLEQEDEASALRMLPLPNKEFLGSWEGLVFDVNMPDRLLRFVSGMGKCRVASLLAPQLTRS